MTQEAKRLSVRLSHRAKSKRLYKGKLIFASSYRLWSGRNAGSFKVPLPESGIGGGEQNDIIRKYSVSCIDIYRSIEELNKKPEQFDEVYISEQK